VDSDVDLNIARERLRMAVAEAVEARKVYDDLLYARATAGLPPELPLMQLMEALDRLPREPFGPGVWYNEAGDVLEVVWENTPSVSRWLNHLVTIRHRVEPDGSEGPVTGVSIWGARAALAAQGVWVTPDPPNPSREVQEAQRLGVCRVCRQSLKIGAAPAAAVERFANLMYPDALVFNCGEEYAHQACLNAEVARCP